MQNNSENQCKNNYWIQKVTDCIEQKSLQFISKIGLKKITENYMQHQEGMRYLIFGGLSTVVNVLVFILLKNILLSTLISNFIAWIISVIFAYITNKLCVFYSRSSTKKQLLKELISFIGCRIATLVIDEIFMWVTIDYLHFNSILMKIVSNIIVIILNFFLSKILIFNKH